MSERELRRVEVLLQVICGSLSQEQAVSRRINPARSRPARNHPWRGWQDASSGTCCGQLSLTYANSLRTSVALSSWLVLAASAGTSIPRCTAGRSAMALSQRARCGNGVMSIPDHS